MNHVTHHLSSADISNFSSEISKFCYIRKNRYRLHLVHVLSFFESLKIFLINMFTILMMPAKLATPDLLEIKIFQNKSYDVIIPDYDITNKVLSSESNYI